MKSSARPNRFLLGGRSVGAKLVRSFAVFLGLAAITVAVTYWSGSARREAFALLDQALEHRAAVEYVRNRLENLQSEISLLTNVTGSEETGTDVEMVAALREDRFGLLSRLEWPFQGSDPADAVRREGLRVDVEELLTAWASFHELRNADPQGALFQLITVADPLALRLLGEDFPAAAEAESAAVDEAIATWTRIDANDFRLIGGIFLVTLLIGVGVAFALVRDLVPAVVSLRIGAEHLRDGELAYRIPLGGDDELTGLARTFNQMADHLEQASDSLEDRNRELADTLAQLRTAQTGLVESAKLSALGEMLAGLAHELNNPMASVLGYGELLQAELRGDPGEEARDTLRFVDPLVSEVIRARELIRSLLQFSRTSDMTLKSVDLAAALDVAIGLRGFAFKRAGLTLETDLEPDLFVIAEAQRLQQVFVNIINNALGAMEAGAGTTLQVSARRFGDRVEVLFDDDGPGISDVAKIFEPFFTTKGVGEGTGLGLTLVHRFQEEFEGSVAAETSPDGGARFVLTYRVGEPTGVESREDAETLMPQLISPGNGKRGRLKVLLAEDEASIREFQIQMLKRLDVEVVTVDTAAAAQALLQREHVDVIVSDVRMPGEMNGADLFRWICSERPELTDRFLFVTGDVHDPLLVEWRAQYPDRFLIKPFRMKDYLERVGQMLNGVESELADHSVT